MVGAAIRDNTEFGIVLAKEEGIVNVGCTVTVEQVLKQYDDGRMDILTSGRRRFEIVFLNEEESYLRGEVQYFDDEDAGPAPPSVQEAALSHYRTLLEIGGTPAYGEANLQDPQLSFQIAQGIPDLDFLHLLLRTRSEVDRLKEVTDFLTQYVPRQRRVSKVKAVAPLNGFGGTHPEP